MIYLICFVNVYVHLRKIIESSTLYSVDKMCTTKKSFGKLLNNALICNLSAIIPINKEIIHGILLSFPLN